MCAEVARQILYLFYNLIKYLLINIMLVDGNILFISKMLTYLRIGLLVKTTLLKSLWF